MTSTDGVSSNTSSAGIDDGFYYNGVKKRLNFDENIDHQNSPLDLFEDNSYHLCNIKLFRWRDSWTLVK